MFCPKCGSKLKEDAVFCAKCGAKIKIRTAPFDDSKQMPEGALEYKENVSETEGIAAYNNDIAAQNAPEYFKENFYQQSEFINKENIFSEQAYYQRQQPDSGNGNQSFKGQEDRPDGYAGYMNSQINKAPAGVAPLQQPKKKKTGLITGIIAGAVVVIIVVVLIFIFTGNNSSVTTADLSDEYEDAVVQDEADDAVNSDAAQEDSSSYGTSSGYSSYEEVLDLTFAGIEAADLNVCFDLIPEEILQAFMDENDMTEDGLNSYYDEYNEELAESWETIDEVFDEWSLLYEISESEYLSGDDLTEVQEVYGEYGVEVISVVYTEVGILIETSEYTAEEYKELMGGYIVTMDFYFIETEGGWYLDIFSMGS